ncbi:MAG: helix-turn-helix domain-containing protein [Candidatus Bathyarchaeota archaeon]|nr:helix-turn-helix domain-containing protein [Candidatus Bathyarchaeota archaeon]MDW8040938.1 helix-turn-helix domain-containing protein [Nitrososphaerota archaeon]
MTYRETEQIKAAEVILKEGGFTVSQRCCSRPSCFDIAARKNDSLILIKAQQDIGCVSPYDSLELRIIAEQVSAASLFISDKTRDKPLEDDTVYSRYNVLAITPKTFENIVLRGIYPLIQAGPGGYYVEIDGEAIKKRRQELSLSVGEVAEKIGISRRTLYGYERGMAKASVTVAYNLLCTLGVPVAKPINIFEAPKNRRKTFMTRARKIFTRNKLLQKIFKKLTEYNIVAVRKAPFDFVVTVPEENIKIIGGVAESQETMLNQRVEEILSLSKVVHAHPVLVTNGRKLQLNKDIPCLDGKELSRIKSPEDLCKL